MAILTWLAVSAVATSAPSIRYVASRQLLIEYRADASITVSTVDVWVSTDAGRTWSRGEVAPVGEATLRYDASADGRYDFYVVLHNDAGASADPPGPGSTPTISVVVDSIPPLLQVHAAHVLNDTDRPAVVLDTTLIEENLSAKAVRVFYRTIPTDWIDGGPAGLSDGRLTWPVPISAGQPLDLRLLVADLAGNQCVAAVPPIRLPPACDPTTQAGLDASPAQPSPGAGAVTSAPPSTLAPPAGRVSPTSRAYASPPSPVTLAHLRQLADRFVDRGEYSLAAARFEDALELAPEDADLLVDLGSTLYRLGRYDESATRFESALTMACDHVGAMEGLALVAATQRRYAVAREHLQHLLRLRPHCGTTWLRAGDVEHRLGNTRPALEAWRRALVAQDADEDLRRKARRRLDYFGPPPAEAAAPQPSSSVSTPSPPPEGRSWQRPPPTPRSSLSTETKTTRSQPP